MSVPTAPRVLPEGVTLRSECSCGWVRDYSEGFDPEEARRDMREHLDCHGFGVSS